MNSVYHFEQKRDNVTYTFCLTSCNTRHSRIYSNIIIEKVNTNIYKNWNGLRTVGLNRFEPLFVSLPQVGDM